METQKNQIVERLKQATNILVTVSNNPSVDQLAAAIGFTLLLNKQGKHATAVFSGAPPSTIEFLQPEKTLEKNTDSLRDFIIALDKSKADKLRYKVEDQMVKIFITPYMSSISEKDLEFSQGDFNVEVVVALGVKEQQDLDQAITAHGRILHDATVIAISTVEGTSLGSINWVDPAASSLCEMLTQLGVTMKEDVLDSQMATALLTGIVAETNRFSNEKTSSETMQISAKLMTAGANQQLVATELQPPPPPPPPPPAPPIIDELPKISEPEQDKAAEQAPDEPIIPEPAKPEPEPAPEPAHEPPKSADGTLLVSHEFTESMAESNAKSDEDDDEPDDDEPKELPVEQINIDDNGRFNPVPTEPPAAALEPPKNESGGSLLQQLPVPGIMQSTSNESEQELVGGTDLLGTTTQQNMAPILSHDKASNHPEANLTPEADAEIVPLPEIPWPEPKPIEVPAADDGLPEEEQVQTLAELEETVMAARVAETAPEAEADTQMPVSNNETSTTSDVNSAQEAVNQALQAAQPQILDPVKSLNAHPMDLNLGDMPAVATSLESAFAQTSSSQDSYTTALEGSGVTANPDVSPSLVPLEDDDDAAPRVIAADPNAPPPVPPPMMPPFNPSVS